jgi:hypothetical protein
MIDVEQHALRAFEQDSAPPESGFVEVAPNRAREGQYEIGDFGEVFAKSLAIDGWLAEPRAQSVVVRAEAVE